MEEYFHGSFEISDNYSLTPNSNWNECTSYLTKKLILIWPLGWKQPPTKKNHVEEFLKMRLVGAWECSGKESFRELQDIGKRIGLED